MMILEKEKPLGWIWGLHHALYPSHLLRPLLISSIAPRIEASDEDRSYGDMSFFPKFYASGFNWFASISFDVHAAFYFFADPQGHIPPNIRVRCCLFRKTTNKIQNDSWVLKFSFFLFLLHKIIFPLSLNQKFNLFHVYNYPWQQEHKETLQPKKYALQFQCTSQNEKKILKSYKYLYINPDFV